MAERVLVIAHQYLPSDPRIRRQLDALADEGVAADVVCLRREGQGFRDRYRTSELHRMPVRRHRGASLAAYLAEYAAFFASAGAYASLLYARHRHSAVVTHTLPDPLVFAALVPRLTGARVVMDMHEFTPELFETRHGLSSSHPLIRVTRWLERASTRFASRVVTVHEPGRELLGGRGVPADKLRVVPNTDRMRIRDGAEGPDRYAREGGPFRLVYHGLLANQYDLATALRAVARLRETGGPDARLRIVGEGPEEGALRALAAELELGDAVTFEAPVSPDEIPAILESADAGVVPMRDVVYTHLTLPMKLLELAATGVPAITTPSRTIRHYLGEDAVLYVPFGDADALAEAIRRLAGDAELRAGMRRNAAEAVRPLHWGVVGRHFVEVLRGG